jgi:hypothetical protein
MKATRHGFYFASSFLGAAGVLIFSTAGAGAQVLYQNDFGQNDPGATDFYNSSTGAPAATTVSSASTLAEPIVPEISVVPSGGGNLGLTAPQGESNYAEIANVDDAYGYGDGQSVFTDYGYASHGGTYDVNGNPTGPGIANNGKPFHESTEYYINTNWSPASASNNYVGFWIDTAPQGDGGTATINGNTVPDGDLDETNFRIVDTGNGSIGVEFVGYGTPGNAAATITQSGWYTFKTTFDDDNGLVSNTLSVSDVNGNVLGSAFNDPTAYTNTSPQALAWSSLEGTNYGDWTTVWQDGFGAPTGSGENGAADILGIDNVQVGIVPEPASFSLLGVGALALLRRRRRVIRP